MKILDNSMIECDPDRMSGVPCLKGTRFTIAQIFADVAAGDCLYDIAEDFNFDHGDVHALFEELSMYFNRNYKEIK